MTFEGPEFLPVTAVSARVMRPVETGYGWVPGGTPNLSHEWKASVDPGTGEALQSAAALVKWAV
jgi:hypothetical protein